MSESQLRINQTDVINDVMRKVYKRRDEYSEKKKEFVKKFHKEHKRDPLAEEVEKAIGSVAVPTRAEVQATLLDVFDVIKAHMSQGNPVVVPGFARFDTYIRPVRPYYSPAKGCVVDKPRQRRPKIVFSRDLIDALKASTPPEEGTDA